MAKPKNSGTAWQFALVNNRLTELFFDNRKIMGHYYVVVKDYKTKETKKWISGDTKKLNLSYYNGKYRNKIDGKLIETVSKKSPNR
ncbi:MAG: hypothetical protein AAB941_00950 [Patescibacteria group bacterium]